MESKPWWTSKTLYANAIALIAMIIQGATGKEIIGMDVQVAILAVINIILRFITKQPVVW